METITAFICAHSQYAHLLIFALLMLAGLNIPISEDVLLIAGGLLAYTIPFDQGLYLYLWVFLGCYLSAWEAYWLGRLLGPKLTHHRWFGRWISAEKLEKIQNFYAAYGFLTFLIGRFIPFGVRNCLFIASGMGAMPFLKFIVFDGIACFISSATLFYLAYCFGKNHQMLYEYLHVYQRIIGLLLVTIVVILLGIRQYRKSKRLQVAP